MAFLSTKQHYLIRFWKLHFSNSLSLIARFMGPTWGPCGADRTQVGPMFTPWTLLSGLWIDTFSTANEISLRWVPQKPFGDISTLVQVMAWCRQAASHYLSQWWLRSMSLQCITRWQWVKPNYVDFIKYFPFPHFTMKYFPFLHRDNY